MLSSVCSGRRKRFGENIAFAIAKSEGVNSVKIQGKIWRKSFWNRGRANTKTLRRKPSAYSRNTKQSNEAGLQCLRVE